MLDANTQAAPCPYETAARAAGWEPLYSAFTRCGVTIAYVDWKTLCRHENIPVPAKDRS